MIRGGENKTSAHPDFPSAVYGYVQFRADPDRRHAYSTPFEDDQLELMARVARQGARLLSPRLVEPTFLVAKFELVTVEAVDCRARDER